MNDTIEVVLSEIIELIGGGTPKTSIPENWGGEIPWLSVVDFNNGKKYVFETEKMITTQGLKNSSTKILKKGDIIISARGTVGVIAVLGKQMAFNQSCYGVRTKENLSTNDYIYYLLKDTVPNFLLIAHGGVFDTITRDTFNEINVILPPLPEQKAIASVLSCLDDKIDLLHRQNKTLETMAETLFRQWFVEEVQEEWGEKSLENCVDLIIDHRGKTPKKLGGCWSLMGIPAISAKNIKNGKLIRPETFKFVNQALYEKWMKIELQKGDIILTSEAPLGEIYLHNSNIKFVLSQRLFALRSNKSYSPYFLYCFLKSPRGQHLLKRRASGSTVQGIRQEELKKIEVINPPHEKIESFSKNTFAHFEKIKNNTIQIRTLEKLRDTLLPKLMSGEVRVEYEN